MRQTWPTWLWIMSICTVWQGLNTDLCFSWQCLDLLHPDSVRFHHHDDGDAVGLGQTAHQTGVHGYLAPLAQGWGVVGLAWSITVENNNNNNNDSYNDYNHSIIIMTEMLLDWVRQHTRPGCMGTSLHWHRGGGSWILDLVPPEHSTREF